MAARGVCMTWPVLRALRPANGVPLPGNAALSLAAASRRPLHDHGLLEEDAAVMAVDRARERSAQHVVAKDLPLTKYGGRHTVTLLPGVGIGPELMQAVRQVFSKAGVPVDFEEHVLPDLEKGAEVDDVFEHAILSIQRNKVALKGNIELKSLNEQLLSRTVLLRRILDLHVFVMEARSLPGVRTARQQNVDVTLVRQNTEGEYFMLEHSPVRGTAESIKIVTEVASERVARFAFEYALLRGRRRVTVVHNTSTLPVSDGLFVEVALRVAAEYPSIEVDLMWPGLCCTELLRDAGRFDVILTPNLYGVYLGGVLSGLVGGPGLVSGTNYGSQAVVFEPGTRNKGTQIQGRGVANPLGILQAAVDMLHFLGRSGSAGSLRAAMEEALRQGCATQDIGGTSTTAEFVQAVCDHMSGTTTTTDGSDTIDPPPS